ncbi:hypothetical protein KR009_008804 [Drosophila setifemur]|nr:hypothetical protein KR009_008804 [Drosophila setifemur]
MSARFIFWIFLGICAIGLSYTYRLIENQESLKTCPARNKDAPLIGVLHLNDQQEAAFNVNELNRKHPSRNIENESGNWLMRIINIKTIEKKTKQEDVEADKPGTGFANRLFNILRLKLKRDDSDPKMILILKSNIHPQGEHRIVKKDSFKYNVM